MNLKLSVTCPGDDGKVLDVIFLDFTMPFDADSHSILIDELSRCGMSGFTLFLVKNWLKGRGERIVMNGMTSGWGLDTSSTPQGSILKPDLFNMCVKYLLLDAGIECTTSTFAHDKNWEVLLTPLMNRRPFRGI